MPRLVPRLGMAVGDNLLLTKIHRASKILGHLASEHLSLY
jgi:hypothetical protein